MKIFYFAIAASTIYGAAFAQTMPDSQKIIEQAYSKAISDSKSLKENASNQAFPMPSPRGVDPMEIVKNYNERYDNNKPRNLNDSLTIYISTSMPKGSLVKLANQAKKIGATLTLRGLVAPLGTPKALEKTIAAVEPFGTSGAAIQIDPEAFKRLNITAVPTFVIEKPSESCDERSACESTMILSGDVSIEYALEKWESMGGRNRARALPFLNRIRAKNE